MTIQFKGSEYEALKALIKPGKCPSGVTLRRIESFLMTMQREHFQSDRVLHDLDDLALDFLVECGIVDNVVVSFRNVPGFLLNPDKIVRVWLDLAHTNYTTYNKTDANLGEYAVQDTDGQYYTLDNQEVYYRETPNGRMEPVRVLSWRMPETEACPHCSREYTKSLMVFNSRVGYRVDKWCHGQINSYQHPRQDVAAPIQPYHSHRHTWTFYPAFKGDERSMPMGVEIEMHNKLGNDDGNARIAARNILINTEQDYPHYYFETDGSLSPGGFEMITNPMTLEFGTEWWGKMLPIIRKVCVGYGVEKLVWGDKCDNGAKPDTAVNYGIHITVSRKDVPDIVLPKLQRFFDDARNREFIHAVAQRNVMYGGYYLGGKQKPKAKEVLPWAYKDIKSIKTTDRRSPINIKGGSPGLIEFRMFRSTLNTVSFLKNLEFIDAIVSYYKEQLGMSTDHRAFIAYVLNNRRRYPNLIEYLKHPVYFVKGCGVVKNTWLPLVEGVVIKKFDPLREYGPAQSTTDAADASETAAA